MNRIYLFFIYIAMLMLSLVSMWTTYVSLSDSILPGPTLPITIAGTVWKCSIPALLLSVSIGLMLLGLKAAIVNGEKRLNPLGVIGLTIVAFISIAFNIDVLYRTADRDFFMRYSGDAMRGTYDQYLAQVQGELQKKRVELLQIVARQEGEREAEIKGLREAPAGYGPRAREEDYKLTLMAKQAEVELQNIDQALTTQANVEYVMSAPPPKTLDEIQAQQNELRIALKDMAAASGIPLPETVRTETPLFAVFMKLSDYRAIGAKEIFFLAIAFFLDLGDILGYSLIGNKKNRKPAPAAAPSPMVARPAIPVFRAPNLLTHEPDTGREEDEEGEATETAYGPVNGRPAARARAAGRTKDPREARGAREPYQAAEEDADEERV